VKPEELALVVDAALERHRLSERLQRLQHEEGAEIHQGRSAAWRQLVAHVDKVAPTDATARLASASDGVELPLVSSLRDDGDTTQSETGKR